MKEQIDRLRRHKLLFTATQTLDPKAMGIKKRVDILRCVDKNRFYHFVLFNDAKSRFLQKNAEEVEAVYGKTVQFCGHNFKYRHIFIKNGLCSKAKKLLEEKGWKVYNDPV